MDRFKKLKEMRKHIVHLPGFKTDKDFDIAVEIGHHELNGTPLTQKQLLLLEIASPATVRRHLNDLIKGGLVDKSQNPNDLRVAHLKLSRHAHDIFNQCIKQISELLR